MTIPDPVSPRRDGVYTPEVFLSDQPATTGADLVTVTPPRRLMVTHVRDPKGVHLDS